MANVYPMLENPKAGRCTYMVKPPDAGTIKVDWIQLPVEQYLAALPTLKQGITNAEKLQLSVFLPNDLSLEDWYAGVYGLPTVWPEVSMMGADHLRKVAGYDFHDLRKKYDVKTVGRS